MLRRALLLIATLALVAALAAGWQAGVVLWPPTLFSALVVVAVVFENWRYSRPAAGHPGPGWERTAERFIDPETGRMLTVWFNPATGERRYVGAD